MQKNIPLSDRAQSLILGSLLGDGSLKLHTPYKNARFSFRHTYRQKEYFDWKVAMLDEISSDHSVFVQGENGKDGWGGKKLRYQSRALPQLTELYELTHQCHVFRIQRRWLNKLTPESLAIWWCDDGSLVSDSRQGVFCTDGFRLDGVKILDRYMKKVWGISTKISSVNQQERKEQYRLWIRSTENLQKFLRIIIPHIPVSSMLPKVLLLYRDPILQQRWTSEVIRLSVFSEEEIQFRLLEKRKKWKNFR